MSRPKAYDPQQGYQYQILFRLHGEREWESIDYAVDKVDKNYLLGEYRMGNAGEYKAIPLPKKYHNPA